MLTKGEISSLSACLLHLARRSLGRRAFKNTTDPSGYQFRSRPADEIYKTLGIADFDTELLIRRLGWWRSIATDPTNHVQILAALFSQSPFEKHPGVAGLTLTEWAPPWANN